MLMFLSKNYKNVDVFLHLHFNEVTRPIPSILLRYSNKTS